MKKYILLVVFISSCATQKKGLWTVYKPETEREWRVFNYADSAVKKMLGIDSIVYDWANEIEYDYKGGKVVPHKFKTKKFD